MTSRPYESTREKILARDLARARDALAMAYSGLDRARAGDPYFDIDKRMALVREDMDYLDREYGGARHRQHLALAEPDVSKMNLRNVHDNIHHGDNDDGSAA